MCISNHSSSDHKGIYNFQVGCYGLESWEAYIPMKPTVQGLNYQIKYIRLPLIHYSMVRHCYGK